uniref:YCII-related protein n=1 Tax=Solibacter usitatus (strain Ellin6076) TaxID=234267 RepID=Q028I9_SOLUE
MRAAILLLFAAIAAPAANFFVAYEVTSGIDLTHMTPQQVGVMKEHGANLMKLRESGVLLTAGRMLQDPKHLHAMAIIVAENEAAAKDIAAADPAVRAGIMRFTVEPMDLVFPPVCK